MDYFHSLEIIHFLFYLQTLPGISRNEDSYPGRHDRFIFTQGIVPKSRILTPQPRCAWEKFEICIYYRYLDYWLCYDLCQHTCDGGPYYTDLQVYCGFTYSVKEIAKYSLQHDDARSFSHVAWLHDYLLSWTYFTMLPNFQSHWIGVTSVNLLCIS